MNETERERGEAVPDEERPSIAGEGAVGEQAAGANWPSDEPGSGTAPVSPPAVPAVTAAPAGGSAGQAGTSRPDEALSERARRLAEQVKPVAIAAEEVTARAVDLSAKGLTKLSGYLERRRQERRAAAGSQTDDANGI